MAALPRSLRPYALAALACLLVPAIAACSRRKYQLPVETLSVISERDGTVHAWAVTAEVASRTEERNWGYQERRDIPDGTGMLFVFAKDEPRSFWMHNTPHPLSIAYIGSDGTICDILDMTPYSEALVKSSRSVRFALEVPQGWFAAHGIAPGDRVVRVLHDQETPLSTFRALE